MSPHLSNCVYDSLGAPSCMPSCVTVQLCHHVCPTASPRRSNYITTSVPLCRHICPTVSPRRSGSVTTLVQLHHHVCPSVSPHLSNCVSKSVQQRHHVGPTASPRWPNSAYVHSCTVRRKTPLIEVVCHLQLSMKCNLIRIRMYIRHIKYL